MPAPAGGNSNMKKSIKPNADHGLAHLEDLQTCPHCDVQRELYDWHKHAVHLVLEPRVYKAGHVAVVMECPSCFNRCWLHCHMSRFAAHAEWPKNWVDAVKDKLQAVMDAAAREWQASLCRTCKRLEGTPSPYNNWRSCLHGGMGIGPPRTICDRYIKGKSKKPATSEEHF